MLRYILSLLFASSLLALIVVVTVVAGTPAVESVALKPPPLPPAGPLAQPRSLEQVGIPTDATRAAIPPDNPQTAEKIALGQKLFFDGRLSADGTVACSTCPE